MLSNKAFCLNKLKHAKLSNGTKPFLGFALQEAVGYTTNCLFFCKKRSFLPCLLQSCVFCKAGQKGNSFYGAGLACNRQSFLVRKTLFFNSKTKKVVIKANISRTGEIFKESFTDIFCTDLEQTGFSLLPKFKMSRKGEEPENLHLFLTHSRESRRNKVTQIIHLDKRNSYFSRKFFNSKIIFRTQRLRSCAFCLVKNKTISFADYKAKLSLTLKKRNHTLLFNFNGDLSKLSAFDPSSKHKKGDLVIQEERNTSTKKLNIYSSLIAGNSSRLLKVGDYVNCGDKIGEFMLDNLLVQKKPLTTPTRSLPSNLSYCAFCSTKNKVRKIASYKAIKKADESLFLDVQNRKQKATSSLRFRSTLLTKKLSRCVNFIGVNKNKKKQEDSILYLSRAPANIPFSSKTLSSKNCFWIIKNKNLYKPFSLSPELNIFSSHTSKKIPIIVGESGKVVKISKTQIALQKTQPILFYSEADLNVRKSGWVKRGTPILTLTHQTLVTGDIVQGIPRIEQLFEAFTSFKENSLHNTLHSQVRDIFRKNWLKHVLPIAVRQSLEEIQQILVESIQKVYLSQGVLIADKHIEIVVRQMTSKVQILDSGSTGFLLEEVVPIRHIENANITTPGKKALYAPAVVGLTAAALSSDSFISAASFQETTRVLSRDAMIGKSDFLRGLKEKVVIGDLIAAGTGLEIYFIYNLLVKNISF